MWATLHCGARASHCGGFSCCRARALGMRASVVVSCKLSSCGSRALEHRLSSCGSRAYLLRGMWDLPGPGLEPVSPTLAGRFLTPAPPGKPSSFTLNLLPGQGLPRPESVTPNKLDNVSVLGWIFAFSKILCSKKYNAFF